MGIWDVEFDGDIKFAFGLKKDEVLVKLILNSNFSPLQKKPV